MFGSFQAIGRRTDQAFRVCTEGSPPDWSKASTLRAPWNFHTTSWKYGGLVAVESYEGRRSLPCSRLKGTSGGNGTRLTKAEGLSGHVPSASHPAVAAHGSGGAGGVLRRTHEPPELWVDDEHLGGHPAAYAL